MSDHLKNREFSKMSTQILKNVLTEATVHIARIAPWAVEEGKFSWTARFVAMCFAGLLVPVGLLSSWLALDDVGSEGSIGAAAVVALLGMIVVGVGLMGLIFYSNRSGLDDSIYDAHIVSPDEDDNETDTGIRTS